MKYTIKEDTDLRKRIKQFSNAELLKMVVCPNYNEKNISEIVDTYCLFIHPTTLDKAQEIMKQIKNKINHPVLIASDMEAGPGTAIVGATRFPSMRALKEAEDEILTYLTGKIAAREALDAGYNWTFGPCVDILGNHFSPITSIRSASENYQEVIKYTTEYAKGIQDNNMVATAKHFPGDGNCLFDQHLTTAINPLTKKEWDESYRKVYQALIDMGIKSIMPGHIALPAYDEIDETLGLYPPATLSYNLLTTLLKEDLGFNGLIISDATEMTGFCGYVNYYEACARFLVSGGDCLLFTHPTDEYITKMSEFIESGYLTRDILEDRAYRVLAFVEDNCHSGIKQPYLKEAHQHVSDEIVEKSIKVFRDRKNLLPIKKQNLRIAHVVIAKQIENQIIEDFTKQLKRYGQVTELIDPGCNKLKEIAKSKGYDLIICTIGCSQWYGTNQITLSGTIARNMMNGWMKYDTPVVFVDFGNPYLHEEYNACIDTLIYTYGYANKTIDVVTSKIFNCCDK